jgi:hypothetical protein
VFRGFFDFMAKMGLSVRDDPPKVVDLTIRSWGEPADGLVLSVYDIVREDSEALPRISVVIRNIGTERKSFPVPGWLYFYQVEVRLLEVGPRYDSIAPLSPFGRELLKPERRTESLSVALNPAAFQETEIPIGSLFNLRARGRYSVSARCLPFEGVTLRSNTTIIG